MLVLLPIYLKMYADAYYSQSMQESIRTIDATDFQGHNEIESNGITVSPGEVIQVSIKENQTTGGVWIVDHDATEGLFTVEEMYVAPEVDNGMVGVPGTKVFTLSVAEDAQSGDEAMLRALYERPWMFEGFESFDPDYRSDWEVLEVPIYIQ